MDKQIGMDYIRRLEADAESLLKELNRLKSNPRLDLKNTEYSNTLQSRFTKLMEKLESVGNTKVIQITCNHKETARPYNVFYSGVDMEVAEYMFNKNFPAYKIISKKFIELGYLKAI